MAWSTASPPTGMRSAVTIEPRESTATCVACAPHTMIMVASGCSTGSPQPTAAAISVSTSSTRRAPRPTSVSIAARWESGSASCGVHTAARSRGLRRRARRILSPSRCRSMRWAISMSTTVPPDTGRTTRM